MRRSAHLLAVALWLVWVARALAFEPAVIGQSERLAAALRDDLTQVEKDLQIPDLGGPHIAAARRKLEDIRSRALAGSQSVKAPIAEVSQQLASLGPAPAAGATESESLTNQRNALTASLTRLQAAQKQLDLLLVETEQQGERAATLQRSQFFRRIFEPNRSILNPALWYDGIVGLAGLSASLRSLISNWWADISGTANFPLLILAPALLAALVFLYGTARRWLLARYDSRRAMDGAPDDTDRLWRIVRGALFAFIAASALVLVLLLTFRAAGVLTPRFERLFTALGNLLIFTALMGALARRIAAPREPQWRIIDVDDAAAARFATLATLAAFISRAQELFAELSGTLHLPIGFSIAQSGLSAILMLVLIGAIIIVLRNQQGLRSTARGELYFGWVKPVVPLIWLILGIAATALLLGYIALAAFIAQQLIDTAYLVAGLFIVHHLSEAVVVSSLDPGSRIGQALRRLTGLGSRGVARLGLLMRTIIDLALALVGIPLVLLKWTVTWIDFAGWFKAALVGVKIGSVTISLSSILLVLAVFAAGVAITKLLTRWLDTRVLAETSIDRGVRDSIRKGASYAGYILAAGFALSAAGVEFSNLALIAGALGIGIGFGLQSIVNNFISGLILLAERPVRVGDWVQLASGEGIVRRIKVRSTEIETFDNCIIIVPNSSLVTEAVRNWTHQGTIARFRVTVGVPYDTDAQFVKDTMLKLAKEHTLVLHSPEPKVLLAGISTSALDFELRAYVGDVMNAAEVASDIRFALFAAFREKGLGTAAPAVYDVRIVDGSLPTQPRDSQAAQPKS